MTDTSPEAVAKMLEWLRRADEYEPLGHDAWETADLLEALAAERAALSRLLAEARGAGERAGMLRERQRILDGLRNEVEACPCEEDAMVFRDTIELIEADFCYDEVDRLRARKETT